MKKFTKDYCDTVIKMFKDKEVAKDFLKHDLYSVRYDITKEHYDEMQNYIENM